MRRREEDSTLAAFQASYARPPSELRAAIELGAIGASWGANGYTTVAQADELGRRLELRAGRLLLDLGTGRGWPGLYLAARTGCSVIGTDVPFDAVRAALHHARDERIVERVGFVVATANALPFRRRTFDAVVHTDVLC